jgi:exodeoxyribonuclease VII small subunit
MPRKKKTADFESSLTELEALVDKMEEGDLSLEESLGAFEEGVQLTRQCQHILEQAEQKVRILIAENGKSDSLPFEDVGDQ